MLVHQGVSQAFPFKQVLGRLGTLHLGSPWVTAMRIEVPFRTRRAMPLDLLRGAAPLHTSRTPRRTLPSSAVAVAVRAAGCFLWVFDGVWNLWRGGFTLSGGGKIQFFFFFWKGGYGGYIRLLSDAPIWMILERSTVVPGFNRVFTTVALNGSYGSWPCF